MDYERLWLHTTQISATARYIMKIDAGERDPAVRESMVERLRDMLDKLIQELSEDDDEVTRG